jgi:hypothetical protein
MDTSGQPSLAQEMEDAGEGLPTMSARIVHNLT